MLADGYNLEILNGGMIFRQMAADRDLTLPEFGRLAEEDSRIDAELDRTIEGHITAHCQGDRAPDGDGHIVESRLAGWHADGRADIAIGLGAPADVRARRLDDRTETTTELQTREESERTRYQTYYDIDIQDYSVYDLTLDTETFSEEGMYTVVSAALDEIVGTQQ